MLFHARVGTCFLISQAQHGVPGGGSTAASSTSHLVPLLAARGLDWILAHFSKGQHTPGAPVLVQIVPGALGRCPPAAAGKCHMGQLQHLALTGCRPTSTAKHVKPKQLSPPWQHASCLWCQKFAALWGTRQHCALCPTLRLACVIEQSGAGSPA